MPTVGSHRTGLAAAVLVFAAGAAYGQQYTATILTPAGINEAFIQSAGSGHQVGLAGGPVTGGNSHAFLWSGTGASAIDLNPEGFDGSGAYGSKGNQQVGVGYDGEQTFAMLWTGTAASAVILNPQDMNYAAAYGTDGATQVGLGRGLLTGFATHGLAWTGTAESVVDIHPVGYNESYPSGIDNGMISGTVTDFAEMYNAGYWTSPSADSWVALHPVTGYDETTADAISGTTIGGRGYGAATGGPSHALLWLNGGETLLDIHPAGYRGSFIFAMRGAQQAGVLQLFDSDSEHAVVWSGTAASAIDLHELVPDGPWLHTRVTGIDDDGNLYGYATNGMGGVAVRWTPVGTPNCGPADMGSAGGVPGADGILDNNDFIAFINHFFELSLIADVGVAGGLPGSDGQFDNNDFIAFINLFFEGC